MLVENRSVQKESNAISNVSGALERGIREAASTLKLNIKQDELHVIVLAGVDDTSHALLHVLSSLRDKYRLKLTTLYNGSAKSFEMKFFEQLCARYGTAAVIEPINVQAPAPTTEQEKAALRLAQFEALRKNEKANFGISSQTPRDNAELLFSQLLSSEMVSEFQVLRSEDYRRRIIRPFLNVHPRDIDSFVAEQGLNFIPQGRAIDELTNLVRGRLLPTLAQSFNGDTLCSVNRVAERIGRDEEFLWREAITLVDNDERAHALSFISSIPTSLTWRVLLLIAEEQVGSAAAMLSHDILREIAVRIAKWDGHPALFEATATLSYRFTEEGELRFEDANPQQGEIVAEFHAKSPISDFGMEPTRLDVPGVVVRQYDDGSAVSIEARIVDAQSSFAVSTTAHVDGNPHSMAKAYFNLDEVPSFSLKVRERRLGDRVQIADGKQRKVKRLLDERGVPSMLIERLPIVESNSRVLWVPGIASANFAHPGGEAGSLLELSYRRRE